MNEEKEFVACEYPVTVTVDDVMLKVYDIKDDAPKIRFASSTDTPTLYNAINGVALKLSDFIGKVIEITKIVITTAEVNRDCEDESENAEKVYTPVVHLFTTSGEHISTLSKGIGLSVKGLLEIGIIPTPEYPIRVKVIEAKVKRGLMHSLELIE